MNIVLSYLNRIAAWVRGGWPIYSGPIVGLALPVLAFWWAVPAELYIRIIGFLLQILGVAIVWIGIRGTRKQFDVPGGWAQAKTWLSSFPSFRHTVNVSPGSINIGITMGRVRASAWSGVPVNATVAQRLEAVEKNVRRVRDDLSAYQKECDDVSRTQRGETKRERKDREAADDAIHRKIKETETGGLELNAAGLWWLFFGTVYSTFPVELASAFVW